MSTRSNKNIIVRDVDGPDEVDAVRTLLSEYATEFGPAVRENLRLQGFERELRELPGRFSPPSGALVLATVNDLAAGCVALRDSGDGTCEMKRLYVSPQFRSLGLGRLLVSAILDRGRRLGHRRMVLDSTEEMGRALSLYRSFGFVETEPYGVSTHAFFFQKDLTVVDA